MLRGKRCPLPGLKVKLATGQVGTIVRAPTPKGRTTCDGPGVFVRVGNRTLTLLRDELTKATKRDVKAAARLENFGPTPQLGRLGIEWTGSPGSGQHQANPDGTKIYEDEPDHVREMRLQPELHLEVKPPWADRFFNGGLRLEDAKAALKKAPASATVIAVPEWNSFQSSYVHVNGNDGPVRHKLWKRSDLEQLLAAEDHYRGIMPPETHFNGLASSDAEHATAFDHARFEAMGAVNDAAEALKLGQCRIAGSLIDQGYINYGRMEANAMTPQHMGIANAVHKLLRSVDEPFEKQCVRPEPVSESHARTLHAMRPGLAGRK